MSPFCLLPVSNCSSWIGTSARRLCSLIERMPSLRGTSRLRILPVFSPEPFDYPRPQPSSRYAIRNFTGNFPQPQEEQRCDELIIFSCHWPSSSPWHHRALPLVI